jgi:hypothetical protein
MVAHSTRLANSAEYLTGYHRSNIQHQFDLVAFMRINPAWMGLTLTLTVA